MTAPSLELTDDSALLEIMGQLHLSIGDLTTEMKAKRLSEQARLARLPINIALERMSSPGAATTDIQDFGGPQPGRQWVVRLLAAIASPIAANASVVTWYVGTNVAGPAAGQLPATFARWQFPSVPGFQNFTSDVIKLVFPHHVIAGLTSIPASSNIGLVCVVNDQPLYAQHSAVAVE